MTRRSIADNLRLDQSLRAARTFYFVGAVIFVPCAILFVFVLIADVTALVSEPAPSPMLLAQILFDVVVIAVGVVDILQLREANRRLKRLAEDPAANVKPVYYPKLFQDLSN